jgi:hypothetical protein
VVPRGSNGTASLAESRRSRNDDPETTQLNRVCGEREETGLDVKMSSER